MVVLEGFHALKHALRFGADVKRIVTFDRAALLALATSHAPELRARIGEAAIEIARKDFKRLGPYEPHTGVVSVAVRAHYDPLAVLAAPALAPAVVLDEPRHRGNLGAVVRVAAAAEAAGVLTTGAQDPWHPVAVRGSAGLHFALPVAWLPAGLPGVGAPRGLGAPGAAGGPLGGRPLVVLDPAGEPFDPRALPERPLLVFGSERQGVAEELRARADQCLALPMRAGVSSLNLATSVAAVLYSLRLATGH